MTVTNKELIEQALSNLAQTYDHTNGGWGGAPKFPAASTIELLLARGEGRRARV